VELALVPFVMPLLLLGWFVDAWRERTDARPPRPDPRLWEKTWFQLQGRPAAERERQRAASGESDEPSE